MPEEADKPGGEPDAQASEDEQERPTVSPPFDPVTFARNVLNAAPASQKPEPRVSRAPTPPTGTPAQEVVTAPPPGAILPATKPPEPPVIARGGAPVGTLSMLNARVPSNLPPISFESRKESVRLNAVDQEWAALEVATRPPPPDSPNEDPELEIAPPSQLPPLDLLDEVGFDDEHAAQTVRRPVADELAHETPAAAFKPPAKSREREMDDRVSLGDYSGALQIAEQIVAQDPGNAVAQACAENCRTVLRQMYATRIGPFDRVPMVMVPRDQLRWLSIDHRAGFVLSLIDGVSSLEMIIDVSGMPELDTLRILSELAQQRIISLR